jgi:hypothetical protein
MVQMATAAVFPHKGRWLMGDSRTDTPGFASGAGAI